MRKLFIGFSIIVFFISLFGNDSNEITLEQKKECSRRKRELNHELKQLKEKNMDGYNYVVKIIDEESSICDGEAQCVCNSYVFALSEVKKLSKKSVVNEKHLKIKKERLRNSCQHEIDRLVLDLKDLKESYKTEILGGYLDEELTKKCEGDKECICNLIPEIRKIMVTAVTLDTLEEGFSENNEYSALLKKVKKNRTIGNVLIVPAVIFAGSGLIGLVAGLIVALAVDGTTGGIVAGISGGAMVLSLAFSLPSGSVQSKANKYLKKAYNIKYKSSLQSKVNLRVSPVVTKNTYGLSLSLKY